MAIVQPAGYAQYQDLESDRTTVDTLKSWASTGERYDVFTCCDATTAHWLCLGGARVLLVSCDAVSVLLGVGRVQGSLMASIGAAVSRAARDAFVIVDYPNEVATDFVEDADQIQRLHEISHASAIKVRAVPAHLAKLLAQPAVARVPIVATPLFALATTSFGKPRFLLREAEAAVVVSEAIMPTLDAGAAALFLEFIESTLAKRVVSRIRRRFSGLPIMGSNTGDACPGRVHLLHDVIGLAADESSSAGLGVEIVGLVRRCLNRDSVPLL